MSDVHDSLQALQSLDLNLFVAFDALAHELNVTRAAARLHVTQSAMSHTLRRLRDAFDDPLLVRSGGAMVLTPRAEALVVPVRDALLGLRRVLATGDAFDPETSTREFRVAAPDLVELLLLPGLMRRLRDLAPGVRVSLIRDSGTPLQTRLQHGSVDVGVAARSLAHDAPHQPPLPGFLRRTLLTDTWTCLARADHPVVGGKKRLTLKRFLALPHAMVSPTGSGSGVVDIALAELGHSRTLTLRVPHFFSAPVAILDSDLLLTVPTALTTLLTHLALRQHTPPIALPALSVDATWHARMHHDAGHRWFREQLALVAGEVATSMGRPRRG